MPSGLDSHFGVALQSAKGSPIITDSLFEYMYFTEGTGVTPNPVILPLDQEIGAGPLVRDVRKVAVSGAGSLEMIPRPNSIGWLLLGALGVVSTTTGAYHEHLFKFATNQFDLPYFTMRRRTTAVGGDVASDVRIAQLAFNFQSANFLRAQAAFLGASAPSYVEDTSAWTPDSYLDSTPPLLTCLGSVELPDGTSLKALSGSVTIVNGMPLEEQFILGQLNPDDIEVTSRAIVFQFAVKADASLYRQMMYDADGGSSWSTTILKEADIDFKMQTSEIAGGAQPYEIAFHANGQDEASGEANIAWNVQPISVRGNRQVVMAITGTVLADSSGAENGPFSVVLKNSKESYS